MRGALAPAAARNAEELARDLRFIQMELLMSADADAADGDRSTRTRTGRDRHPAPARTRPRERPFPTCARCCPAGSAS